MKTLSNRSKKRLDDVLNAIDNCFDTEDIGIYASSFEIKRRFYWSLYGPARDYVADWIIKQ